jgi:hypothetical protein
MVIEKACAALAVFVERETRLVVAQLLPDLRPVHFTAAASCLGGKQTLTLTLKEYLRVLLETGQGGIAC